MILTIHGLPFQVKYQDIKTIIQQECNLSDFILGSLAKDEMGMGKKLRVGLTDSSEASILIRRLDGYQMGKNVLKVLPVGSQPSDFEAPLNEFNQPSGMINQNERQDWSGNSAGQWNSNQLGSYQNNVPFQQNAPGNSYSMQPGMHSNRNLRNVELLDTPRSSAFGLQDSAMAPKHMPFQNPSFAKTDPHNDRQGILNVPVGFPKRDIGLPRKDMPFNADDDSRNMQFGDRNAPFKSDGFQGRDMPFGGREALLGPRDAGFMARDEPFGRDAPPGPRDLPGRDLHGRNMAHGDIPSGRDFSTGLRDARGGREPTIQVRTDLGPRAPDRGLILGRDIRDIGHGRDGPLGGRDGPMGGRDGPMGGRDGPLGGRDGPLGGRDGPISGRDGPIVGRDLPLGGRGGPLGDRNMPRGGRDLPLSGRDLPIDGRDGPLIGRDIPHGRRDMLNDGRDMPHGGRDMPLGARDMPHGGRDMPQGARDMPHRGRDMPHGGKDMPNDARDMSRGGRDLPHSGRDIPFSGRDMPGNRGDRDNVPSGGRIMPFNDQSHQFDSRDMPGNRERPRGNRDEREVPLINRDMQRGRDAPHGRDLHSDLKDSPRGPREDLRDLSLGRRDGPLGRDGPIGGLTRDMPPGMRSFKEPSFGDRDRTDDSRFGQRNEGRDFGRYSEKNDDNSFFSRTKDDVRIPPGSGGPDRVSPRRERYSPRRDRSPRRPSPRLSPRRSSQFPDGNRNEKSVRPAYEPSTQNAPQAIYSGYRPNINENVQYPIPGQNNEARSSSWQGREKSDAKKDEDRQFGRPFDTHRSGVDNRPRSRSPNRRDRSPQRDRFKRNSRSPKRSWPLDKRQNMESQNAPPPPSWPGREGHQRDIGHPPRGNIPDRYHKDEERKPIWEANKDRGDFRPGPSRMSRHEPDTSDVWKTRKDSPKKEFSRADDRSGRSYKERDAIPLNEFRLDDELNRSDGRPRAQTDFRHDSKYDDDRSRNDRMDLNKKERRYDDVGVQRGRDRSPNRDSFFHRNIHNFEDKNRDPKNLDPSRKHRDEAAVLIVQRIMGKYGTNDSRLKDELELSMKMKLKDMFGIREMSPSSFVLKFDQICNDRDQDKMFNEVVSSMPRNSAQYKALKRKIEEPSDVPNKRGREADAKGTGPKSQKELIKERYKRTIEIIRREILIAHDMRPSHEDFKPICEELNMTLLKILLKFGEKFGPSCDILKKYKLSYTETDERRIFEDVVKKIKTKKTADDFEKPHASRSSTHADVNVQDTKGRFMKTSADRVTRPTALRDRKTIGKLSKEDARNVIRKRSATENMSSKEKRSSEDTKSLEKEKRSEDRKSRERSSKKTEKKELTPLMAKVMEEELKTLMDTIWKSLPNKTSPENEKEEVERFVEDAGEDISNVFALNLAQRLLNVHNDLSAQVQLDRPPSLQWLKIFGKKFKVNSLQFMSVTKQSFIVQTSTFEEYDKVCASNNKTLGKIKVSVLPLYNFTKCPENLKIDLPKKDISKDFLYEEMSNKSECESHNDEQGIAEENPDETEIDDKKENNEKLVKDNKTKKDNITVDNDNNFTNVSNRDKDVKVENVTTKNTDVNSETATNVTNKNVDSKITKATTKISDVNSEKATNVTNMSTGAKNNNVTTKKVDVNSETGTNKSIAAKTTNVTPKKAYVTSEKSINVSNTSTAAKITNVTTKKSDVNCEEATNVTNKSTAAKTIKKAAYTTEKLTNVPSTAVKNTNITTKGADVPSEKATNVPNKSTAAKTTNVTTKKADVTSEKATNVTNLSTSVKITDVTTKKSDVNTEESTNVTNKSTATKTTNVTPKKIDDTSEKATNVTNISTSVKITNVTPKKGGDNSEKATNVTNKNTAAKITNVTPKKANVNSEKATNVTNKSVDIKVTNVTNKNTNFENKEVNVTNKNKVEKVSNVINKDTDVKETTKELKKPEVEDSAKILENNKKITNDVDLKEENIDTDILSIIEQGIVLDECAGSDDDE